MGGEAWGGWWEWAWQKLHRAGGKVPSLPLGGEGWAGPVLSRVLGPAAIGFRIAAGNSSH